MASLQFTTRLVSLRAVTSVALWRYYFAIVSYVEHDAMHFFHISGCLSHALHCKR